MNILNYLSNYYSVFIRMNHWDMFCIWLRIYFRVCSTIIIIIIHFSFGYIDRYIYICVCVLTLPFPTCNGNEKDSNLFLREFHNIQSKVKTLNPYSPFLRLLNKNDYLILEKCYKCLAKLFELDVELKRSEVENLMDNISNQLQSTETDAKRARMCLSALMILLKRDECRDMFYKARGISALIDLLHDYVGNVQILYETCFCLWLLSFNKNVETYFQSTKVIPR